MALLPRSRKARSRLLAIALIGPVLAGSAALALWGLREGVSFFYTPSQAAEARPAPGRTVRIGGLVQAGSVVKTADGQVRFVVTDQVASLPVQFRGDLPDLFREGQGVVAQGAFGRDGRFTASEVLAKHDENYMPPEVARGLDAAGSSRTLVENAT